MWLDDRSADTARQMTRRRQMAECYFTLEERLSPCDWIGTAHDLDRILRGVIAEVHALRVIAARHGHQPLILHPAHHGLFKLSPS